MQAFGQRTAALRTLAAVAAMLAVASCVGIGGGGGGQLAVTTDAVTVAGPRGFCVDPEATTDRGTTAFVLMGNCAAINGSRMAGQPAEPAILTAAISEPGAPDAIAGSLSTLPEFFASADGRRVLSRSGDPETVTVDQSFAEGAVFYLHATDASEGATPGVSDSYWRAYFDVGPRIATLSVLTLDGSGMGDDQALALLRQFVAATQAANPAPAADGTVPPAGGGFLGRILPART
ncbi:hypothetical protein HKCCE2091_17220 [Rhodobacterales bacterium HKCCE2091]|nr:hypothetical protein [Rhodobacterales bacterium HKCCE2091]